MQQFALSILTKWIRFVQKAGVVVLAVVFALTFLAFRYTADNLKMNTDTEDMLSTELAWRKLDREYEELFPQYDDNILVVVEADTPDQALDAAGLLYRYLQPQANPSLSESENRDGGALLDQRLQREDALFDSVYYPNALPVFRESGLLYLDTEELQDLSDSLAAIQPFLAKLVRDPSLRGLFDVLSDAIDALQEGEEIDIEPVLAQINTAVAALEDDEPFRVSWQQLMSGENSGAGAQGEAAPASDSHGETTHREFTISQSKLDSGAQGEAVPTGDNHGKTTYREFIILQPKLDFGGFFPATQAIDRIHGIYEELNIASSPGADIHLTGNIVLAHEELQSVMKGTETAIFLALCLVTIIMLLGLGSAKLALVTIISLVTGLIFTAAFATVTIGRLNLISVAFAVLYIGLGVDAAIHYCLRYKEYLTAGENSRTALNNTSTSIGGSLFLCAASTAIGFFAFIPTDYTGVAELGWISGFGMMISFVVTLTVIPALLALAPLKLGPDKNSPPEDRAGRYRLIDLPTAHAGKILGVTAILVIASALLLTNLRFDHNPLNLHDQDGAALNTFRRLLADNGLSPWTGVMIASDAAEAARYEALFAGSDLVEQTRSVADFIPGDQEAKLSVIDEMSLLLGDLSGGNSADAGSDTAARAAAVSAFRGKLQETRLADPVIPALRENLARLLEESDPSVRADKLARLEHSVLASLPGRLDALNASLNADFISLENLPPDLKQRWVSADGQRRIEIYPGKDMQDNVALREFVRGIQAISPRVVGSPVLNLEASDAVAVAFRQAFLYAFIAITLMLSILLTRKRDVLLVLIPLLTAAIITGGISVLADIPLNFANVIALPLLLGIGVDSGIHIIHRFRTDLPAGTNILATSSARAVIVSCLTSMGGIGNLALSPHAGMAGMGMLLTLGIGITLVCMLVVLPALLTRVNYGR